MSPHVSEESDSKSPEKEKNIFWIFISFLISALTGAQASVYADIKSGVMLGAALFAFFILFLSVLSPIERRSTAKRIEEMKRKNREEAARLQNQLESQMREMLNGRPLPPEIESKMEQLLSDMQSHLENMDSK